MKITHLKARPREIPPPPEPPPARLVYDGWPPINWPAFRRGFRKAFRADILGLSLVVSLAISLLLRQ
jgi:hypothetical protein